MKANDDHEDSANGSRKAKMWCQYTRMFGKT
jgi:hypothetical protein